MRRGFFVLALAALACAYGCGGGGKGVYITQFPRWEWRQYQRIAVLPFKYIGNERGGREAARQVTYLLQDELAANGHFTVLERDALKNVLTEQDLSQLADVADPSTVIAPGKIQAAQAIVTGTISSYKTDALRHEQRRPVYVRDDRGQVVRDRQGRPLVSHEEVIEVFEHRGAVSGSVRVIDTATGKVIFSYAAPTIAREDRQAGAPPRLSPDDLAMEAAKEIAIDCYTHVAPIQVRVNIKGDSLFAALDYYDGQYDRVKKIPLDVPHFLLVVRQLPRECDRNPFRVALAPEGGRNIFEEEFVWSAANPVRGQFWEIPLETLTSAGGNRFVAKLYSGNSEQPILQREFELSLPEEKGRKSRRDKRDGD